MSKSRFSEVCDQAGDMLKVLAKQAESCDEPVQFVQSAFQPCLGAIANVLKEFADVKLVDE